VSGEETVQNNGASAGPDGPRTMVELDREESLALLASVPYGRVVFTQNALPAIRPVNHLVDNGRVVIRTRLSAKLGQAAQEATVVAYQADQLDPQLRTGWSVVVTGFARTVTDQDEAARLSAALRPWADLAMDTVVVIEPELVTGYRLVAPDADH
jgi:nitroimidazol reductase NimA-like FMN-containing flavoprotein (pyridoxamine 5'-phosphate oxidase superfamily)